MRKKHLGRTLVADMYDQSPHSTLLALHQPVDSALVPFYEPIGLDCTTESISTVSHHDLMSLASGAADPIAAVVTFGETVTTPALLVVEPALCSSVLSSIWRSDRNRGARLTAVESEILRQHTADIIGAWSRSWRSEGVRSFPRLAVAATLATLPATLPTGNWLVARTVVLDSDDQPTGVLLFCYPEELIPVLHAERLRIRWRTRIEQGLTPSDRERLRHHISGALRNVHMPAQVSMTMKLPLRLINNLERGDVLDLGCAIGSTVPMNLLDRTIIGQLARIGGNLAISVRDVPADDHVAHAPIPQHQTA